MRYKRLLDRQHVGVARRLEQELDYRVERLIRVMNDQILFTNGGEGVAGVFRGCVRAKIAHCRGGNFRIVARGRLGDFRQGVERQQARQHGDPVFRHIGLVGHEIAQGLRQFGGRIRCGSPSHGVGA